MTRATLFFSLALAGCADELATSGGEDCQIDRPTLLLAESPDWGLGEALPGFSFESVGERLLLVQSGANWVEKDYFLRDLCGGEPERILSAEQGFFDGFVRESSAGPVLFAAAEGVTLVAIDRLAEPGVDAPRPIGGLPVATDVMSGLNIEEHGAEGRYYVRSEQPYSPDRPGGAAGIGGVTRTVWAHSGEPDEDGFLLATEVVRYRPIEGSSRVLVHTDDGRVRWIDRATRGEELVREGVRWVARYEVEGRLHLVMQAITDGKNEPVILRDVETGAERTVTVNPFAEVAFGRDPAHPKAGQIYGGAVLGLLGPDGTLVEAHDNVTLAPLEIPAHVGLVYVEDAPAVGLVLPDPVDHVLALWDPSTGAVTEWFRGPQVEAEAMELLRWQDGAIRVFSSNPDGSGKITEVDPATGAPRVLLPRYGAVLRWFDDGRVLHTIVDALDSPTTTVALSDLRTGTTRVLVERARRPSYHEARDLLLYLDHEAETPGLWAMPLP